ncbi:MAG: calcium-binding protein [Aquisalinus sp.]|nr:calcium-binding protein [Aquisalinus sp.]
MTDLRSEKENKDSTNSLGGETLTAYKALDGGAVFESAAASGQVPLTAPVSHASSDDEAAPRHITSVQVNDPDTDTESVATFGFAFQQGDLTDPQMLIAQIGEQGVPVQIDVKSSWEDGSVKHAVLSLQMPAGPGGTVDVALGQLAGQVHGQSSGLPLAGAPVATDYDFSVEIDFAGQTHAISVSELLAEGTGSSWLAGPLVGEQRVSETLTLAGKELTFSFDVRTATDGSVRTAMTVSYDNVYTTNTHNLTYDYRVIDHGAVIDSGNGLRHIHHTNWHESYHTGNTPSGAHVVYDMAYLQATNLIPRIDTSLSSGHYSEFARQVETGKGTYGENLDFGPMGAGSITQHMPSGGSRPDIGYLTEWAAMYIVDQTAENKTALLENAYAGGSINWHLRDPETGLAVRLDDPDHAQHSWDFNETWRSDTGSIDDGDNGFTLERGEPAHKPALNSLAYLVTGDRYHLDEMYAEVAYGIFGQESSTRNEAGFSTYGQLRGKAWLLRDLYQASSVAPDGDYKDYLDNLLEGQLQGLVDFYVNQKSFETAYGPSEYAYDGREIEGAMMHPGRLGDTNALWLPWHQDYMGVVIGEIAATGNALALQLADWMANFNAGRFLQSDFDPTWAATYQMARENRIDDIHTWADVGAEMPSVFPGFRNGEDATELAERIENDPTASNYPVLAWASLASLFSGTHDARYAEAYAWIAQANQLRMVNFQADDGKGNYNDGAGARQAFVPVFRDGTDITFADHHFGTDAKDTLAGGEGNEFFNGADGNDLIRAGEGNHLIEGGDGLDVISAGSGEDWIFGGLGADIIMAGAGQNYLQGDRFDVDFGRFADSFVFEGVFGQTVIGDFEASDTLYLNNIAGITSLDDVLALLQDDENGTAVLARDDLGRITFEGWSASELGSIIRIAINETPENSDAGADDDDTNGDDSSDDTGDDADDQDDGSDTETGDDDTDDQGDDSDDDTPAEPVEVTLTDKNDFHNGDDVDEIIHALKGNDTIHASGGNDLVSGDRGNDKLHGGAGDDELSGGDGNDYLLGEDGDDRLLGDRGNDILDGGLGEDYLDGGVGNDQLFGGESADTLLGGMGNDKLYGDIGNDSLFGDEGRDELRGEAGDDELNGGFGNDKLFGGAGSDILLGREGNDRLEGQENDDQLYGGLGKDTLLGGLGNDFLNGDEGNDRLFGDLGEDALYGAAGNDYLNGEDGDDVLFGGADKDRLIGGNGNDQLDGEDGDDRLEGNDGDDVLSGGAGNDRLDGGLGDDSLNGGDGDDHLHGRDGNDMIAGDDGADRLYGHEGNDHLDGGAGDDRLYGGDGTDHLMGGSGADLLFGHDGSDILSGGDDDDKLNGGLGDDTLTGDLGHDVLIGHHGNDVLSGGAGDDQLKGGGGNDILEGGAGNDLLLGGSGDDVYLFTDDWGQDVIKGFGSGNNVIDLSGVAGISAIGDLLIEQVGRDTVISFGDNSITLERMKVTRIDEDSFDFGL